MSSSLNSNGSSRRRQNEDLSVLMATTISLFDGKPLTDRTYRTAARMAQKLLAEIPAAEPNRAQTAIAAAVMHSFALQRIAKAVPNYAWSVADARDELRNLRRRAPVLPAVNPSRFFQSPPVPDQRALAGLAHFRRFRKVPSVVGNRAPLCCN